MAVCSATKESQENGPVRSHYLQELMFYKVVTDTELATVEAAVLGEIQLGSCESQVVMFLSSNQYITLFLCLFV